MMAAGKKAAREEEEFDHDYLGGLNGGKSLREQ
jgi:hypothetical protein